MPVLRNKKIKVSVVMPCLNESESVGTCVKQALLGLKLANLSGEVLVADNGSSDGSVAIAKRSGARVVIENRRGYGRAYKAGFSAARGDYLVMGDSDGTYDFREIGKLIDELNKGADMVIGSRLSGNIHKGAMPWTHRYIGTPILSWLLTRLFGVKVRDSQSGFRAFKKKSYDSINPVSTGMEFASELLVGALRGKLKIREVPIDYYPRVGISKLSSVRDAWRHIRFMLLYSPNALFIAPGMGMLLAGALIMALLLPGPIYLNGRAYDIHLYIVGFLLVVVGFQIISLGVYAKTYAVQRGLEKKNKFLSTFYRYFTLERGLATGTLVFITGVTVASLVFFEWANNGFGALNSIRQVLFSVVLIIIGIQSIFTSFFVSLINLNSDD